MLVPGATMSLDKDKDKDDRRGADRFPIEREVRYKILSRKTQLGRRKRHWRHG